MSKLTAQVLTSWLHGNKTIDKLLKTTRSTIDSVEQLVNTELKGDVQTKWLEKISEYKATISETNSTNENIALSAEDEYMNLKKELSLVEKELSDTEQQKAKLKEEFEKAFDTLCSKSSELTDKRGDLLVKIEELEQSLVINLVYDNTKIDKCKVKYFVTFDDAITNLDIDESDIGNILSKNFMNLPANISIQDAISLIKNILFIKKRKQEGRIVKVYGPDYIIKFISLCDEVCKYEMEYIVVT